MLGIVKTVMLATIGDFNCLNIHTIDLPQYIMFRVVNMREIELCMKYDVCTRCPLNKKCEDEYKKQEKTERKNRDEKRKMKQGYYE